MPRISTIPTLYEERTQIDAFYLRRTNSFVKGRMKSGVLTWSRRGEEFASIGYETNLVEPFSYIRLSYTYNDRSIDYKVQLVTVPSNLGKGEIIYFLCPKTGKRCRYLYQIGGYFYHREAFRGVLYEKQTYSKRMREADRFYSSFNLADKARQEINSKYFKKFYAGKPTKRYKKLFDHLKHNAQYTQEDFRRIVKGW